MFYKIWKSVLTMWQSLIFEVWLLCVVTVSVVPGEGRKEEVVAVVHLLAYISAIFIICG